MSVIEGDLTYKGNGRCTLCEKPFSLNTVGITYNNFLACGSCLPAFLRSFVKDYKALRGWEFLFNPVKRTLEVSKDLEELSEIWRKWYEIYEFAYPTELSTVPSESSGVQGADS